LFSRAIHRTAMPYSAFDHPAWKTFFHALRSCYQLPTRNQIGGELMMYEYTETMNEVLLSLGKNPLICFTLDGATNLQGKQVINMMACVPKAFFLEHFTMQLRRESAANQVKRSIVTYKMQLKGFTETTKAEKRSKTIIMYIYRPSPSRSNCRQYTSAEYLTSRSTVHSQL